MEYPYYTMTVPVFKRSLLGLKGVLKKGEAFAASNHASEEVFLKHRLAFDMFDLTKQVQVACDNAKGSSARLAGLIAPSMEDNERSFKELDARIDKTIAYLETLTPEHFKDSAERRITLPYYKDKYFLGHEFTTAYALPNFFFHVVTAYDILRHLGVDVGKQDYMGELPMYND